MTPIAWGLAAALCLVLLALGTWLVRTSIGRRDEPSIPATESIPEQFRALRRELSDQSRQSREELMGQLSLSRESAERQARDARDESGRELREFQQNLSSQLLQISQMVERRMESLQAANDAKLEEMRRTVDEKLHATLEQRLGESFQQVALRLEEVHRGLGEMQNLAQDVGDLRRTLGNVKTRGILGEAQLGALLEQFLAPGQYESEVRVVPGSAERVDYAVKLPGTSEGDRIWLPIDAKFPMEDFQRLMDAYERADVEEIARSGKAMEDRIALEARRIREKYVCPPHTTGFALLFVPYESLYAEVLRRPGLSERLQRDLQVTLVGPTTLAAFLNSLQMGFRTLAISRRSNEVWKVLATVKTEFGKFGDALDAVKKRLDMARDDMDKVSRRTRAVDRQLREVEDPPAASEEPPELL
ncbi:MAG: DNA recombination protein RmuC [Fibrobacterota bacterium]